MYKEKYYSVEDLIDVETMYSEEVVIQEDTWEAIRERAAETGEDPDDIAARFIADIKETLANIPEEVKEMQRISSMYALGLLKEEDEETYQE